MKDLLGPALVLMVLAIGLPLAGRWARQGAPSRCALDGLPIERTYQVRMVESAGRDRHFCCVQCASRWLERTRDAPRAVFVTDEVSGVEIPAADAWFVRGGIVTHPLTGNRLHVFRDRADAVAHAATHGGELVAEHERPLQSSTTIR